MSINFHCECGKALKASDTMAGRKTKCPHCGATQTIPGALVRTPITDRARATSVSHPDALPVEGLDWPTQDVPSYPTIDPESDSLLNAAAGLTPEGRPSDVPKPEDGTLQYKVLAQKEHSASGRVNFQSLEVALNQHARDGWSVKSAFVMNIQGHAGSHDELVVILER